MTDETPERGSAPPRPIVGRGVRVAVWTLAGVGLAAVLYVTGGAMFKPADTLTQGRGAAGTSFMLVTPAEAQAVAAAGLHQVPPLVPKGHGEPAPATPFAGADGKPVTLAAFKGHVVLLNLWATWCAPCRKEMPTLAALQAAEGGRGLKVLAVSVDRASATPQAKAFIAQNAPLAFYQDADLKLPFALKPVVQGFPTTVIYDKAGRERARVASDVDWGGDRVKRVVEKLAAE